MKMIKISMIVLLLMISFTACGLNETNENNNNNSNSINNENDLINEDNIAVENEDVTDTDEVVSENLTEEDLSESDQVLTGEFSSFSATDIYGNAVTQDILLGKKLIIVNIWGTFCGPCINEMPDLGELALEYEDKDVLFIGIPIDVSDESTLATAIDIVEETKANYTHILPSQDLIDIYLGNVTAVPETLILDETGTIIDSFIGSNSKDGWKEIIDSFLDA